MPEILTSDTWDKWLSDDVQAEANLPRVADRAERKVLDRYRQDEKTIDTSAFQEHLPALEPVQLKGYEAKDDGTPDIDAMPADLVTRLRDSVARIVTHWTKSPSGDVKSKSVGSKSVTYDRDPGALPHSVFTPLRPYDDRTPYSPGV